jgi:hypothetical protein
MRVLRGAKVVQAETGWRDEIAGRARPVVIDVGAGDGRFVYESARRDPGAIYIGLDPDAEAMAKYAFRAGRKPSRGGIENAVFVVASVEQLPAELLALADRICVNFPWTGLLRGIIRPESAVLEAIAGLAATGARFDIVLCYDPEHDSAALEGEALPALDYVYIDSVLIPAYAEAGLQVTGRRRLPQEEALAIPSTWGRRLLHGRPRDVFQIRGIVQRQP